MESTSILGRLRLSQKFMVLSVIALILAAIPTWLYTREAGKALEAYEAEQAGLPAVTRVLNAVQLVQQHRALSSMVLGGLATAEERRTAKQAEADKAYAAVDEVVKQIDDKPIQALWAEARKDWDTLRNGVSTKSIPVMQSVTGHSNLLMKMLKLNELVGDYYVLSLDPDKDSYQLIQAMYYNLPGLTEEMGRMRARGLAILAKKEASPDERLALSGLVSRVEDRMSQAQNSFGKAAAANPDIDKKLGSQLKAAADASAAIVKIAQENIVKAETIDYSSEAYLKATTEAIDLNFKLIADARQELEAMMKDKIADFHKTRWSMLGVMALLIAAAGYLTVIITRSVTLPLGQAVEVAQSVAKGDLVGDFDVGPPNEVGQMLRALKEMNDSLRNIVSDVRSSVDNIGAATRDIASGNADVSSRLESQASNLEETASSMEQLTSTVKQNADNARQANELVLNASSVATKGGDVVSQVVQTMGEINESSRKIVDIISVIDGIAFQTNILALNAAVEAARAGEQGRGFAVVASEVRNLAQRSAGAAKEIKELIGHSVEKVEAGNQLADQAGAAMNEILTSVQRITQIVSDIAVASAEQGDGIEQVNQAVVQMDDMTQQNAALVEQTAAASATLQEQAQTLVSAMSVFRLGHEQGGAARIARSDRPRLSA